MSKIVRVNGAKTDGGQTYIVYIDRGDIQYQKVANMFRKWPTCETIERSHFECWRPSSTNPFHPRKRPSHWSIPILLLCMWHAVEMSVWCWASLDLCVYLVLSRTLSTILKIIQKSAKSFFQKMKNICVWFTYMFSIVIDPVYLLKIWNLQIKLN